MTQHRAATSTSPVSRLVGVTIAADRVDELAGFYRAVLGATLTAQERSGVRFYGGDVGGIELQLFPKHITGIRAAENLHQLRFAVTGFDDVVETAHSLGVVLHGEIVQGAAGRIACIRDPDGNTVELIEVTDSGSPV
jgi:predicted enzyme related to lactoylglutathione lyase